MFSLQNRNGSTADQRRVLYVTDLDGTLLNADMKVDPESADILNGLIESGTLITAATARGREPSRRALTGVDLRLPLAFLNGGYLAELAGGPIRGGFPLPPTAAEKILADYLARGLHPMAYTIDDAGEEHVYYQGAANPAMAAYVAERLSGGDGRFRRVADLSVALEETVVALNTVDEPEPLATMHAAWNQDSKLSCHYSPDIYAPAYCWLEFSETRANKGDALLALKELVGADHVVCFGDNTNDLAMFAVADESYAVAHAHPAVKEAATAVLDDDTAHAVARRIRTHAAETARPVT
ncbi:MAG: HAD family phosphatase [Catenulispora sp.]|nr:HAD family phosphatase [Catenulispora sp.]